MTGTPLDLTPFGPWLKALPLLYWLPALVLIGLVLWLIERWWLKLGVAAAIAAAFAVPAWIQVKATQETQQAQYDAAKAKLDTAMAHFEMRCKSSGEKITRTVENVEGVVWMKWRDKDWSFNDQFKLDDPLGKDCGAEECIAQLLRLDTKTGRFERETELRKGRYRFVESVDPADGLSHRYTGTMKPAPSWTPEAIERHRKEKGTDIPDFSYQFSLQKASVDRLSARYGITWDDISTREDRKHWIAGSSLKVIDLQTNEILAERIGYLIDTGQGSTAGFRTPWGWAKTYAPRCPKTNESTQEFAIKVLRPIK